MNEKQRDIKAEFDQFWDCVGDVVLDLVHSDYSSTDTFLSNYEFVKTHYFKFNDTLTPDDRKFLAENHLCDFVEFLQCSTAIAAIAATLDHISRPQTGAAIH